MKALVVSADYPSPEFIYGDVFVHTRLKQYKLNGIEVAVIGYNEALFVDRNFFYEGIPVQIVNDIERFYDLTKAYNPDVIIGHLIRHLYIDFFISLEKPLVIFIHGFEATSWKRRLMNYNSVGAIRYLIPYIWTNTQQLRKMRALVNHASHVSNIKFVFVSSWLKLAVSNDLRTDSKNVYVIPNGIDTDLFAYRKKNGDHRKKVLLIRSFKARNYANDIAIEVILLLSKERFFDDLEFSIYGEGYLFKQLTDSIKHFKNVKLYNFFVENKDIPAIHQDHGIFLCASRMDTQGVSMCEAMSSGLVPISSPIGGIPEYAVDGVSSFLCGRPQEMADRIKELYIHPETFQQMSESARRMIEERCSLKTTIPYELSVMESVVSPDKRTQRTCTHCLLGTVDDPDIFFDERGICSYCKFYLSNEKKYVKTDENGRQELQRVLATIKESGKDKPYDCIIGLSGGVDSTYLAYKAKELGLRPLAVHFDNGWNSELAVSNIENIITKLGLDLYTYVINWEEFRDLQLAFLRASVVDIEMITDHAISATLYAIAIEKDIKFIMNGVNFVTESILPNTWIHDKRDHVHIRAINKLFGTRPLKKFPLFTSFLKFNVEWQGIKSISLLNYFPYIKSDIKKIITKELGWRDYGGKHYESVFTRFYQGYILPEKFGIDKRKAHLSNLICAQQITRDEALEEIKLPPYPETLKKVDYEFVLKKLEISDQEFQSILRLPVKKHSDYPVDQNIYRRYPVLRLFSSIWYIIKKVKQKT